MSRVAAPADRRFRRAHVKPSHRRLNWHPLARWAVVAGAILGALAYGAYRGRAVMASLGTVDQIVVHGNQRLSKGEVLAIMSGLRGESLFGNDLDHWLQAERELKPGATSVTGSIGSAKPKKSKKTPEADV